MIRVLCRLPFFVVAVLTTITACTFGSGSAIEDKENDSLAIRAAYSSSPVLTPKESLERFRVEPGFAVHLVAAEPLVNSPVALLFDEKARMWVLEMQGYMPDTSGAGEDQPRGKVVILEDTNRDGTADTRKIFMDSLVMPRAFCFVEGGMLIAEPPKLWYVDIHNDIAGKKVLVDSCYAEGGNVEHQPNGLMRAMDNWIYSANSGTRYRKTGNRWAMERTVNRGQWGISQDNYGRLFYNNNSENLLGDFFAPKFGATNPNQRRLAGYNEKIIPDNRVYPARPTTGVNRGYQEGILDDSLRLVNFTAASGPVIYRGALFGAEYQENAFVGEPSANLIKRNVLNDTGYRVKGTQAYQGKEFLTSTDERFRPVTLYNGPDGALYVIDLYRGIIQHKTYLTSYLKNEIRSRELTNPINCGRIYKIVPAEKAAGFVTLPDSPEELVKELGDPNGWVRDKAQQMLIDAKAVQVVPLLKQQLGNTAEVLPVIHSLWTLEGLHALAANDVSPLLNQSSWPIRMQALCVLPSIISKANYKQFIPALEQMLQNGDTLAAPYITFLARTIRPLDQATAERLLASIVQQYPDNVYIADAVISNLEGRESAFLARLAAARVDTGRTLYKRLNSVVADIANKKRNSNVKLLEKELPKGTALFKSTCQTCHGADGSGIKSLAPSLNNSEWVKGNKNKLIAIVLFGVSGPIIVNGTLQQPPDINGEMPGMGSNPDLTDDDIAQVISYIRRSWNNNADNVTIEEVKSVRQKFKGHQKSFTAEELNSVR